VKAAGKPKRAKGDGMSDQDTTPREDEEQEEQEDVEAHGNVLRPVTPEADEPDVEGHRLSPQRPVGAD
jgi:hypothetical protein